MNSVDYHAKTDKSPEEGDCRPPVPRDGPVSGREEARARCPSPERQQVEKETDHMNENTSIETITSTEIGTIENTPEPTTTTKKPRRRNRKAENATPETSMTENATENATVLATESTVLTTENQEGPGAPTEAQNATEAKGEATEGTPVLSEPKPVIVTARPTTPVDMSQVLAAELAMAEKLVRLKYPHLNIIEGSIIQETAHPVYKNKRRVMIKCECGELVERATSDLHTFIGCPACKKSIRKMNKAAKKVAALEGVGEEAGSEDAAS